MVEPYQKPAARKSAVRPVFELKWGLFDKEDHVIYHWQKYFNPLLMFILALMVAGCSVFAPAATPTALPTNTPLPTDTPIPTDTPPPPTPTFTDTPIPSPTASPIPFTPPPPLPTATIPLEDQIRIYYMYLDDKGPYGCGEAVRWVAIGEKKSDNVPGDIKRALYRLLTYYQPYWGQLYHAGYASRLAVGDVTIDNKRTAYVNLTGEYIPTDDPCDAVRFKDQIRLTIMQFPLVVKVFITINGHPIGDVMSRKKK